MITKQEANTLAQTWQAIETTHGGQATAFLRTIVVPAIESAAKDGQYETAIDGVSTDFLAKLIAALQGLGYTAALSGSLLKIGWL